MKKLFVAFLCTLFVMTLCVSGVSAVSAKGRKTGGRSASSIKIAKLARKPAVKRSAKWKKRKRAHKRSRVIIIASQYEQNSFASADVVQCNGSVESAKTAAAQMFSRKSTHFVLMDTGLYDWWTGDQSRFITDYLCDEGYMEDVDADEVYSYISTTLQYADGTCAIEVHATYRIDPDRAAAWRKMAEGVKAPASLSVPEKVKWIHDWIGNHCTPCPELAQVAGHTGYEAIAESTSVCEGYAVLFKKICDANGITSRYIVGVANNGPHAWNAVLYGDQWYFVDAYWDDELGDTESSDNESHPADEYLMYGSSGHQFEEHTLGDSAKRLAGHPYAVASYTYSE